jgi:hypothetical protein
MADHDGRNAQAVIWLVVVTVFLLIGWPGMWRLVWAILR